MTQTIPEKLSAVREALRNGLHADNMRPEYYAEINDALSHLDAIETALQEARGVSV